VNGSLVYGLEAFVKLIPRLKWECGFGNLKNSSVFFLGSIGGS